MKFYKNIQLIIALLFVIMLFVNVIMYFYMANSVTIFGYEVNCLYIQLVFILIESLLMSFVYGKKQGLTICLIFVITVAINLFFIMSNLA